MTLTTLSLLGLACITFYVGQRTITSLVQKIGKERSIQAVRVFYIKRTLICLWLLIVLIGAVSISGNSLHEFGLVLASSLAFLGVALFAQWSLLSNVTASVIVFFFFPYRVGDWVEVLDGDNSVSGKLSEITLFHVILKNDAGNTVTYPNSMVFQKAVKIGRPLAKTEKAEGIPSNGIIECAKDEKR